jgi:hypothetical protein
VIDRQQRGLEALATVHASVLVAREDLLTSQWTTSFPPVAVSSARRSAI